MQYGKFPQVREAVRHCLSVNEPFVIYGSPGLGKTDMIGSVAAELGMPVHTEILNTMEPIDLRGLPRDRNGVVEWSVPAFLAKLRELGPTPVLFVDEFNANADSMQVPLMQLALNRRIGPHELPSDCRVCFAGNRIADRAAARRTPTALNNRVTSFGLEPCLKAWLAWAAASDIDPAIRAFLMLRGDGTSDRPGLLSMFDPSKPDIIAFPSPRSWAGATRHVSAPDSVRFMLMSGKVGDAAAAEFEGFLRLYRTMPPLPSILADPDSAPIPQEPSCRYAVAVALSRAANAANFGNALRYMARVGSELQAVTAIDAIRRKPELAETKAYIDWASLNSDVAI